MTTFAVLTEHESTGDHSKVVSAQTFSLDVGTWLVSCGEGPTHWKVHSTHSTYQKAQNALQTLVDSGFVLPWSASEVQLLRSAISAGRKQRRLFSLRYKKKSAQLLRLREAVRQIQETVSRPQYYRDGPDFGYEDGYDYNQSRADFYEYAFKDIQHILGKLGLAPQ